MQRRISVDAAICLRRCFLPARIDGIKRSHAHWWFDAGGRGDTGPQIVTTPAQFSRPPNCGYVPPKFSRALDTLRSTDSQKKISTFDATRCQILRLKCTKFDFRWGSAPDALGSLQRSPDPLTVFKGPTTKGRASRRKRGRGVMERGRKREGKRRGSEGTAKEGTGGFSPQYFGL